MKKQIGQLIGVLALIAVGFNNCGGQVAFTDGLGNGTCANPVLEVKVLKANPELFEDILRAQSEDGNSNGDQGESIDVCHVPPGNSSARHTITVGMSALKAHLKHKAHDDSGLSDYIGTCDDPTPPGLIDDSLDTGGDTNNPDGDLLDDLLNPNGDPNNPNGDPNNPSGDPNDVDNPFVPDDGVNVPNGNNDPVNPVDPTDGTNNGAGDEDGNNVDNTIEDGNPDGTVNPLKEFIDCADLQSFDKKLG